MIYLGFLLHIYQPPNQFKRVLDKIVFECYKPLLDLINSRKNAKFTLNLNWSLTELLVKEGYEQLIGKIQKSLHKDRIEITGTAAYHAILPLIPQKNQIRQIEKNKENNLQVFGKDYSPKGFFPPEMAFGHEIVEPVKTCGYNWMITDDQPFSCIHGEVPWNYIPEVLGIPIFLRSNMWSNKISMLKHEDGRKFSGREIVNWLIGDMNKWWQGRDGYIIIAMDGETFGHHIPGYVELFLEQMLDTIKERNSEIKMVHISELLNIFPRISKEVPPGSWSTNVQDFWSGNFYPLWKNKYNASHKILWELVALAIDSVKNLEENLDKSLNSCTFWWAGKSQKEISPITHTGIKMLIEVIKHAQPSKIQRALELEEELYRVFEDKSHLGMLVGNTVKVNMDW